MMRTDSEALGLVPPPRDGVGAACIVLPAGDWNRILDFLVERFAGIDAGDWRQRMRRGLVLDGRGAALAPDAAYRRGETVWYYRELASEVPIPFEAQILYQDAQLLIADKPHFLPVVPAGRFLQQSLLLRLKKQTGIDTLAPLHRIDRGTAGLVAFSVDPATRGVYQQLFAQRRVDKYYEALAPLIVGLQWPLTRRSRLVAGEPFFLMHETAGAPNSETVFEAAEPRGALSLYRLRPRSGKKHQLRVHMAAIGAAIINDPLYPRLQPEAAADDFTRPLQLLARGLAFTDPLNGLARHFESRRRLP